MDDKEFKELENKYYEEKFKRDEKRKLISKIEEVERAQKEFFAKDGFTRIEKFEMSVKKNVCYDRTSDYKYSNLELEDEEDVKALLDLYLTRLKNKLKLMEEN